MKWIQAWALITILMSSALAGEWAGASLDYTHISGEMKFYNRSACAKKALDPTESVFLIVDNVNMAKSIYRLAKRQGMDTKTTTDLGIQKFRYSVSTLIQMIAAKIMLGTLPLIPADQSNLSPDLKESLKQCEMDNCGDLYTYLSNQWKKSGSQKVNLNDHSNCRVVKKFSTLHSYLNISKPDKTLLDEMNKEIQRPEDFIQSCGDFSNVSEPEVALYQFDLKVDSEKFKVMGFDFWNTLKIYLSWGFRNAPEMNVLAQPFDYLFKSAHLEEMLLLFSNGCSSLKPTECSQKDLTMNNLSFLTQGSEKIDWNSYDLVKPIPETKPNNLFSKPLPLTENDLLNLGKSESADEWTQNFRDNFVLSRGYNKIKLNRALNSLKLISGNLDVQTVLTKVIKDTSRTDLESKQQLYYLCSEFSMASNKDLSLIRKDLWRLKDISALSIVMGDVPGNTLEDFWKYFELMTIEVNKLCENLKQREIWDENFELKKEGFSSWYRQLVYEKKFTFSEDLRISGIKAEKPFLSLKAGEVICQDGIHCARQVLDSMMSLSAVSFSLSSLVPSSKEISSNNMANPYASHLACGAYDPWAKRNKIIFDFAQDIIQTALFGFLPTPVYLAASLDPKRVVSFETLVKEGQVFYDPRFNTKRLKISVIADLGPMIGVPCSVSISGAKLNPFQYYMFNGISVSTCHERGNNTTTVGEGGDPEKDQTYRQACATCTINLQSVAASASVINPIFRVSFFLVKGVVRLVSQLRDPNDLARNWTISPQKVALTYRHDGEITKSCARKLIKGDDCLPRNCESDVLIELTSKYKISPTRTDFSCVKGTGRIEIKECAEPIYVNFNQLGKRKTVIDTDCKLKERI
jgi:hypothetical protein